MLWPLLNRVAALMNQPWYKCNDERVTDVGTNEVVPILSGQPLVVAASGNHPLLGGVAALIPWLISNSSLHFYLFITHVCRYRLHSWALQTKMRFESHTARLFASFPTQKYNSNTSLVDVQLGPLCIVKTILTGSYAWTMYIRCSLINPQHACITVVVLCVCVCVSPFSLFCLLALLGI